MPKCRDCGALINYITLPSGKALPTDPGVKRIVTVRGKFVEGFEPHPGNCPEADKAHTPKKRRGR